jgi:hypothetical protein
MTISPDASSSLGVVWGSVVRDAGVGDDAVHLLVLPGEPAPGMPKAASYPAGRILADEPEDIIRGAALVEANEPEIVPKQRIAVYAAFDEADPFEVAIVAAKLRHELRHGEQRLSRRGDEIFALDEFAEQIIQWKVGGLPGGTNLYNLKPVEADANAAAAMYLRDHHADQVGRILDGDDAALARSNTAPGDLDDLPAKTVAFIFQYREIAEDPARGGVLGFEQRLASVSPLAASYWRALSA